jgi:hypothetical protein
MDGLSRPRHAGGRSLFRARFARQGHLAIGQAEGIVFTAARDSLGEPLSSACDYQIEGPIPPARFWTLHAMRRWRNGVAEPTADSALHSLAILRARTVRSTFPSPVIPHPATGCASAA